MKTQTESVLDVLRIVALIAHVGAIVIMSIQIAAFVLSFLNQDLPMTISDTPMKLTELRHNHLVEYVFAMSFNLVMAVLNVQVWGQVKDALTQINLKNPFSIKVAKILERIGYILFSIWLVGAIGEGYINYLSKTIGGLDSNLEIDFVYLFNAGIVYIISQIFRRGVELQEENELTV